MLISLVTTRIILDILNVDNYGLYKAVGSAAMLFTFINSTFTYTAQRFFSFSIANNDTKKTKDIFNTSIIIYSIIAIAIVFLEEAVGLWLLNTKMNFPSDKINLANFIFQMAIFSSLISIVKSPFNALIIANENFSFFTYTSILESALRLAIVFLLRVQPFDVCYAYIILQCGIDTIMLFWYVTFCKKNYAYVKLEKIEDKNIFREMIGFSNWSILGSIANTSVSRGTVILVNHFFGIATNASYAIADRISVIIERFVSSFHNAFNPQLTKAQAIGDTEEQEKMISLTSRISFYLILIIGIPILFNLDYLLNIWLTDVPPHTVSICRLMIIAVLVKVISGPLWVTILATGNIKNYQIANSTILGLNIVATYFLFKNSLTIESCIIVRIGISLLLLLMRLFYIKKLTSLSVKNFAIDVLARIFIISAIISTTTIFLWNSYHGFNKLMISTPVLMLIILTTLYFIGINNEERTKISTYIKDKLA